MCDGLQGLIPYQLCIDFSIFTKQQQNKFILQDNRGPMENGHEQTTPVLLVSTFYTYYQKGYDRSKQHLFLKILENAQKFMKNYFTIKFTDERICSQSPIVSYNRIQISWNIIMNNSKNNSTMALPFITYQEGQGFTLSKEAQEFLMSLSEDRQLGVVSIVGKYRTGKSFFVNRVLLDQKKGGFQVGPTINPCTKGLWIWKKALPSSTNPNMDIIMIDTEGFGGMDENANHDSRIFLFSLLLSSYFIYNSVGSIDQNALTTLNLIINLAKDIQTKTNGKSGEDTSSFPAFLWVVRDFTLMLQDKNGNKINSKEYLENALEFQKGSSDAVQNKNKIRRHLKHFFQERDCQLMVRPTQNQKNLQRLDQMDNSMLRPQFVNQVEAIRSKIFGQVKAKKINGKALNGNLLITLCKGYMDAINKGHLPNVQSAWFYVCRSEGLRAVKQATEFMQKQLQTMLHQPIKMSDIATVKQGLKEKVLQRFKKRALGSQQTHPDLLQKLQKRLQETMVDLAKKNSSLWQQRYKQQTQKLTESIKQKIYSDEYDEFNQFVNDFELTKDQYDLETAEGDPKQKWKYFNQISENLYRLAAETVTNKVNKNMQHQQSVLQQKLELQQQEIQDKQRMMQDQKQNYKERIQYLDKEVAKYTALQDSHKNRALQYKNQHDKLYEKYRQLYNQHQETLLQLGKSKKEAKKIAENDVESNRSQVISLKSTLEKERALHQMEKKYIEEELERYKERAAALQNECRKSRTAQSKLTSDYQQLQRKFQQKKDQAEVLEQTNAAYSKKIENLITQNSKKSEMMSDQSEWMLEKSYLQNQVSFLKNTINQNKRLHDALLVALQQSLSASEGETNQQLLQANKNLSSALEKIQARCKILQQKYEKTKQFKKLMKNCQSMQCVNCSKSIQTHAFSSHIQQCCGMSMVSIKQKTQADYNKQNLHITVSQTIVKESEDKKKPYTEYKVQISMGDAKWKVTKRFKQFSQLQQMLINRYPYIKFPQSCSFLSDINNLLASKQKNILAEQRRKCLQQYLRDLSKIEDIRSSDIFMHFLEFPQRNQASHKMGYKYQQSDKKERLFL